MHRGPIVGPTGGCGDGCYREVVYELGMIVELNAKVRERGVASRWRARPWWFSEWGFLEAYLPELGEKIGDVRQLIRAASGPLAERAGVVGRAWDFLAEGNVFLM